MERSVQERIERFKFQVSSFRNTKHRTSAISVEPRLAGVIPPVWREIHNNETFPNSGKQETGGLEPETWNLKLETGNFGERSIEP